MLLKSGYLNSFFQKSIASDTPLHSILRHNPALNRLNRFIDAHGEEAVAKMAQSVNRHGEIPLDLISSSMSDSQQLKEILLNLSIKCNVKKLNEPIKTAQVLEKYSNSSVNPLNDHMKIACDIGNKVRFSITQSHTHPQTNDYPVQTKKFLLENIKKNYDLIYIKSCMHLYSSANRFAFDREIINLEEKQTDFIAKHLLKQGQTNCEGMAVIARCFLKQQYPHLNVSELRIIEGDHVVLVIEPDNLQYAVVLDSWAGLVYPLYKAPDELCAYRIIKVNDSYYNVLTSVNLAFHQLECDAFTKNSILDEIFREPEKPSPMNCYL